MKMFKCYKGISSYFSYSFLVLCFSFCFSYLRSGVECTRGALVGASFFLCVLSALRGDLLRNSFNPTSIFFFFFFVFFFFFWGGVALLVHRMCNPFQGYIRIRYHLSVAYGKVAARNQMPAEVIQEFFLCFCQNRSKRFCKK